jgi:hypothetical protein
VGDTILPETEEVSMLIIPACALAKGKGGGGARGGAKGGARHLVLLDSPVLDEILQSLFYSDFL